MRFSLLLALLFLPGLAFAQTNDASPSTTPPKPVPKITRSQLTAAELQKTVDQLTQSNRDMLDLLKNQQAVLEDMQFDRRLQSRQIESLEERLEDSIYQNSQLQAKIAKLEEDAALHPAVSVQPSVATTPQSGTIVGTPLTPPGPATNTSTPTADDPTPPPPASYLPAPDTMSWHRLFKLKGDATQQSDLFHVSGQTWRVLWHNQDKPGKEYANTSALFINAFPKDDTIPQKVCAKLGSGGDATELQGPGNYYLKVEASGGSWELAVEDFR
jgi:TolA-binding protein